jgi:hypothetical protein
VPSRSSSAAPWWCRAEAAARPAAAPLASASTACRACEGVECGPGESCYVHDDGTTTACFPSGLDLDGWTECPRPDDGDDDDDGEDGGGDGDGDDDDDDDDEGDEDDDGDGEEDDDEEEDDGDDDEEDDDGGEEDNDEEDDDEDGEDDEEDDDLGEPGAGGCAGFPEWPAYLGGRFKMVSDMVNLAAAILGIPPPPVAPVPNEDNPNLVAQWTGGQVQIGLTRLTRSEASFDEWMDTVLHEVYHAYQDHLLLEEYRSEMGRHRLNLEKRGINYKDLMKTLEWGPELDELRDLTRPEGDPVLEELWDYYFDSFWRNSRDPMDLSPVPGTLRDKPIPDEEWDVYVNLAEERQARGFAVETMEDYALRCDRPGDVKEAAGRSQ